MEPHFQRVAVIGLGLIGGSVAGAIRARGLAEHVTAYDENLASLKRGLERGVVDSICTTFEAVTRGSDLIVLCVPVLSMAATFEAIRPCLGADDTIITDVGSVKCSVFEAAASVYGSVPDNLVPGHPIAGSEQHGVDAADPDLFVNHKVILTPMLSTRGEATRKVRELWQALEADVVEMDPDHHDTILAQTSHLPHLLAYALVDTLSSKGDSMEIFQYAAGGFRDFSRIAASDPVMWRDIFATNTGPVVEVLDRYMAELGRLRTMIEEGRFEELARVFARSKAARDHFSALIDERNRK